MADSRVFADGALPGYRVVLLDPKRDELRQISEELTASASAGHPLKRVHIVSHGSPGALWMGGAKITIETLQSRADELRGWRNSLGNDSEIVLHGCETGAGDAGHGFLKRWADLTGASMSASTNLTGPARLGGDWIMEAVVGQSPSRPAFNLEVLENSSAVLAEFLFYHDGTAGKLVKADLDGSNKINVLTYNGSLSAAALDSVRVDPIRSTLYYVRVFNDVNRGLYKTDFSGSAPVRISPNTTNSVSGSAVDFVNNKIYLHDDTIGRWYRCNLDGSGVQALQAMVGTAAFAAVDITHSALYYTNPRFTTSSGSQGLYKTDLAMTTVGTRISSGTNIISGIVVDEIKSQIYFHDATAGQIMRANLDGSSPVNMVSSSVATPVHLAVDPINSRLYYYSLTNNTLRGLYRTGANYDFTTSVRVSTSTDAIGPAAVTTYAVTAPSISSVTGPSSGSFNLGDPLDFTVTYDAAVDVTGSPYLPLTVGSTSGNATYFSGGGTTTLVFRYLVQEGDTDGDGIASASPLVLNGGTLNRSGGATPANLTFTPPTTTAVLVDTTAPTISIGSPSVSITAGEPVSYTVTYADLNFSASTLGFADITVDNTGSASAGSVAVTGSGTTRTVTLSGITGSGTLGITIASGTASDLAGNTALSAGPSTTFTSAPHTSPPTDIVLSASRVPENWPPGTSVGTFSATDPDAGDTSSFSLVNGTGAIDNTSFAIVGNALRTVASFDYETEPQYSIRVGVTDSGGLSFEKVFVITVTDVNEAPSFSGFSFTVARNTPAEVLLPKLLAKTSDPEGMTRTVSGASTTSAQGGTVLLQVTSILYTPPIDFTGTDSFEIVISDGVNPITGIVSLTVDTGGVGNGPSTVSVTVVGSDVQLKFAGIPDTRYLVQRSNSLSPPVSWNDLATVSANPSGFVLYTDPSPPGTSFWRAVTTP